VEEVKVIADSINGAGQRLITLQLRYWRGIHAEFMTHRVFSRNASSSRAQPVKKVLEQVRNDPAMPVRFGGNKPGMQDTGGEHDALVRVDHFDEDDPYEGGWVDVTVREAWKHAARQAAATAEAMMNAGYHKQVCNRLLEPFQYISVIVTGTDWDNWDALRCHPAADPSMEALANAIRAAREASRPIFRASSWHLPYVSDEEAKKHGVVVAVRLSTARCARVSYLTHDGKAPDVQSDLALYDRLVGSDPKHMSPTEHQAFPVAFDGMESNLRNWTQHRKFIEKGISVESVYE
jgi:thymidylate synthase ThyX